LSPYLPRTAAFWATALYAGLRYGELRALRWDAVDVASGTIEVRESWDAKAGAHRAEGARVRTREEEPFHAATLYRRADSAWRAAGLAERLRLPQARHTYASFMIAAGVNAKALSQFMGHSSIKVTFDLYGHLMPGSEREAAGMFDAFLERASSQARVAAVSSS
jgi:integrase